MPLTKGELFSSGNFFKLPIILREKPFKISLARPFANTLPTFQIPVFLTPPFGHALIEMQCSQKHAHFLTPPKPSFSHFSILTHCLVSHLSKPQSELHLWVSPLFSSIQLTADNLSLLAAQYCHHTVFFQLPVLPCTNAIFTAVFRVFPNPFIRCYLDNSLRQHFFGGLSFCHQTNASFVSLHPTPLTFFFIYTTLT